MGVDYKYNNKYWTILSEKYKKQLKNLCSRKRKNPKTIIRQRNSYHFNNSRKKIKLLKV